MLEIEKRYQTEILIPAPLDEVFRFFGDAHNLERITPPWLNFKVLNQSTPSIQEGTEFEYKLKLHGFPVRWRSRIINWKENQTFTDIQLKGPYTRWHHQHIFEARGDQTYMKDIVDYEIPMGVLGRLVAGLWVDREVRQIFEYRSKVIQEIFNR